MKDIFKTRKTLILIVTAIVLVVTVGALALTRRGGNGQHNHAANAQKKELYRCPMHPSVTSDHPDKCPICHMPLQKVDDDEMEGTAGSGHSGHDGASEQKTAKAKKELYRCPMHPSVTSDHPDKCPICHMPLQKVDDDEIGDGDGAAASQGKSNMDGRSSFSLSHEKQQLIGVTTAAVEKRVLSQDVRASGRVAFDPELFTAIEEYRQALMADSKVQGSSYAGLRDQSNELIRSSKTKLRLMGLSNAQIQELARPSNNSMNLILPEGKVWVYAEVFEYEVAGVKPGQTVEVTTPSIPGRTFAGKVISLSPVLNSETRSVRVRAQVPDPDGVLRPDSYVNVKIKIEIGSKVAVPENAVLHSGDQDFVFVVKGQGRFEPRVVTIGFRTRDYFEVLSGVRDGESVVTAANFLIDSESRLRSAIQHMSPESQHGNQGGPGQATPSPSDSGSAQSKQGSHAGHGR